MDLAAQEKLRGILRGMKQSTTIVLTDTQLDFALGVCDQIVVLEQGKILFDGMPAGFLRRLDEFRTSLPLESWLPMKQRILKLLDESSTFGSRIAAALGIR
jgi:ABC-type multidrug transport system ATPase subunit